MMINPKNLIAGDDVDNHSNKVFYNDVGDYDKVLLAK